LQSMEADVASRWLRRSRHAVRRLPGIPNLTLLLTRKQGAATLVDFRAPPGRSPKPLPFNPLLRLRLAPAPLVEDEQPSSVLYPSAHTGLRFPNSEGANPHRSPPSVSTPSADRTTKSVPKNDLGPPSCPSGFLSPRQHSWAFTYRALIPSKIGHASPRFLPPLPLQNTSGDLLGFEGLIPSRSGNQSPKRPTPCPPGVVPL
jgi:hypothetical protein